MWKIVCKNILALYRYRDFRVGIFILFCFTMYKLSRRVSCCYSSVQMYRIFDVSDNALFPLALYTTRAEKKTSASAKRIPAIRGRQFCVQHPALFSMATFPSTTVCLYPRDSSGCEWCPAEPPSLISASCNFHLWPLTPWPRGRPLYSVTPEKDLFRFIRFRRITFISW